MAAITVLFGAGGIWMFLAAKATAAANKDIAAAAAASSNQAAATADWNALMSYWQTEMSSLRESHTALQVKVEILAHQREEDLAYIEQLEQHIWAELPPPPPLRRRYRTSEEDP
jgi:hypothetical protein